jgi:hypothetical protein
MAATRFKVKKGAQEDLTVTFDTTNLPSGSLSNLTILWYVKRTLSQPNIDIFKTSASGSITVADPIIGTTYIHMVQADTINLVPGDYIWGFKLYDAGKNVVALSPDQSNGDLILLDSPAWGLI